MITGGNKDLAAAQSIAAIGLGNGLGGDVRQRRTGLGFGQRHGAEKPPLVHRLHKAPLLRRAAEGSDHVRRRHGQEGISHGGDVGGGKDRPDRHLQGEGLLRAPPLLRRLQRHESGVDELPQGHFDLREEYHPAGLDPWLLLIRLLVMGREMIPSDCRGKIKNR